MTIDTLDLLWNKAINKMRVAKANDDKVQFWRYYSIAMRIVRWKYNKIHLHFNPQP